MYALRRLQHAQGAWYWVVHFSRGGERHARSFFDLKYGGNAAARKAALAWRDEQLAAIPAMGLLEFCRRERSNNTSGVPGVHFLKSARQPEGFWQAKLKVAGKGRTKSFSVLQHGARQAYEMAVAAREELLAQAQRQGQDRLYLYDPVAKRRSRGG